ncbi:indole-3-glycerol phosphate synthase [Pacificimonas flava]|uniref:Indole-3-glycerol phosphate synthase n=2 Tax=Pacificimonas TaxID=1960290 RepID=A0A219BAC4_9SPHN|nr:MULTISPECIES: indole-3-glycerol phosphate synthase TrpC [Pacificimonas]MBZ6378619.1 indole-3-glycerol phosphate synthase TrpC [Pacificimonas aurantium]OWV34759.1 indole-3-glycerol phosphate synthase [Pacificimonas flava]
MSDTLSEIIAHKREELRERKKRVPLPILEAKAAGQPATRGFVAALRAVHGRHPLIAELKRASPSKGLIREDFDVPRLARAYVNGGAACLSVLTESKWFQGSDADLQTARQAVHLPVLRKDFLVDPYQIVESRAMGADAILLIMAALNSYEVRDLEMMARDLGLDVLVEVHNEEELEAAMKLKTPLIGINNRDLKTLEVDVSTTERLARLVPKERMVVSESGLTSRAQLDQLRGKGASAFLVGEALMRHEDVGGATRQLIG